jgi:hypothetical protein
MESGLRERLAGAWELTDVVEEAADGSLARRPHGEQPIGFLLYTPDGHMSAQIMRRDRDAIASADWSDLTPEQHAAEARGYFAYCGAYELDERAGTVTHIVLAALFPNWVGTRQARAVRFDGDTLVLSSPSPELSGGRLVTTRVSWERAKPRV